MIPGVLVLAFILVAIDLKVTGGRTFQRPFSELFSFGVIICLVFWLLHKLVT